MRITQRDIFSPANATTVVGLALTIYGALHINSLSGVLILGLGRLVDVFDGPIARRTHTSAFGALLDATCDKIGLAFLIPAVWIAGIAPYWLLIYILAQNLANVLLSAWTAVRGGVPKASRFGKHALFIQNISLGSYALGNTIDFEPLNILGLVLGISSVIWAARATYGYFLDVPEKQAK